MSTARVTRFVAALVCLTGTCSIAQQPQRASGENAAAETYFAECGYCHLAGGTGTLMVGRRRGEENALLADRNDLESEYVRFVVRNGLVNMPPLTRVEVTEAELDLIVEFLTRKGQQ